MELTADWVISSCRANGVENGNDLLTLLDGIDRRDISGNLHKIHCTPSITRHFFFVALVSLVVKFEPQKTQRSQRKLKEKCPFIGVEWYKYPIPPNPLPRDEGTIEAGVPANMATLDFRFLPRNGAMSKYKIEKMGDVISSRTRNLIKPDMLEFPAFHGKCDFSLRSK